MLELDDGGDELVDCDFGGRPGVVCGKIFYGYVVVCG